MLLGIGWETFPSLIDNKKGIAIESDFADRRWLCIEQISPNMPACQIQDTNSFFRHRGNSEISHHDVAYRAMVSRVQRVPVTRPLPDIFSDTRPGLKKKTCPLGPGGILKLSPKTLALLMNFHQEGGKMDKFWASPLNYRHNHHHNLFLQSDTSWRRRWWNSQNRATSSSPSSSSLSSLFGQSSWGGGGESCKTERFSFSPKPEFEQHLANQSLPLPKQDDCTNTHPKPSQTRVRSTLAQPITVTYLIGWLYKHSSTYKPLCMARSKVDS